jgi:hypothetical protein
MRNARHCEPLVPQRAVAESETMVWFLIVVLVALFCLSMVDLLQKVLG